MEPSAGAFASFARAAVVLVALLATASCGPSGCDRVADPVETAIETQIRQIYDVRDWLKRVPVEFAVSLYARAKLRDFLADLEIDEAIEARLRERIDAKDFVDELVPFLLFVREMYGPALSDGEQGVQAFEDHLRTRFSAGDAIPGMEHGRFTWEAADAAEGAEAEEGAGLPAVDPAIAAGMLEFYDAIYLRDRPRASGVGERLACEARTQGRTPDAMRDLEQTTSAASPALRNLLEIVIDSLDPESDMTEALRGVLREPAQLTAATSALVRFIDALVCRHYRFFAARAFRAQQLEAFLLRELEASDGTALWRYLDHASRRRRYGVVVVVDGLQGKLMEALARGDGDDPFIAAIRREQAEAGGAPPSARSLAQAPAQATHFLASFAERGFRHRDYLPFFRRRLADARTHWLPIGISTTPTISVRNIPIALTGAPVAGPGSTGLPNFHFVERDFQVYDEPSSEAGAAGAGPRGRAYYFYGSDAVDLTSLAAEAGMQSLFARLPQLGGASCNAQYDEAAHFGIDALLNLGLGEKLRDFGERLCSLELRERSENEQRLRELRGRLLSLRPTDERPAWWQLWSRFWLRVGEVQDEALARELIADIAQLEQRTLPELLLVYNPWPDHFAHFDGPFADETLAPSGELNRLDYWLGEHEAAYRSAGVLERTVFGLVGDHGLSPVFHLLSPETEVFGALRDEGIDFATLKISSDEGEGPKLTDPFDPPPMTGIDVVVASTAGGNHMLDLFVDQGAAFTRQPLASELRALRPLAQPEARPVDLLEEIAVQLADSLDYLVVREEACSPEQCAVRVIGSRAGKRGVAVVRRRADRVHLSLEGPDLLDTDRLSPYEEFSGAQRARHGAARARCLASELEDPASWCTEAEWRELTSFTPRPDSVVQLAHLYDSDRAGTINLFPRAGVGYNSVVPGRHAGESFHEKNAFVAIWGKPLKSRGSGDGVLAGGLRSAPNGSVPMAIYQYLSGERPERGRNGWGYAPLPDAWFAGAAAEGELAPAP